MYRWFRAVTFILILFGLVIFLNSMMIPIDPRVGQWGVFGKLPHDTVDVLFIGNSHSYCTFAPLEIWNSSGVTTWNLSGGSLNQRHKQAYFEQALCTQNPRLVVVEVWMFDAPIEASKQVNDWAYNSMPAGLPKVRGMLETSGPASLIDYFIPIASKHFPWESFTRSTVGGGVVSRLKVAQSVTGGAQILINRPAEQEDFSYSSAVKLNLENYQAGLVHLRSIRNACVAEGLDVIFCLSPMRSVNASEAFESLSIDLGGDSSQVRFVNMNDYAEDMNLVEDDYYDRSHLYLWGMKKASKWFADEVLSTYDLPDRRGSALASQWNEWYRQWELDTRYTSPVKASK